MNRRFLFLAFAAVCTLTGSLALGVSDEAAVEAGRKVFADSQNAVVNVDTVIKITGEGEAAAGFGEREQKLKVIATFIEPSGLAVTSLMAIDPVSAMPEIHGRGQGGQEVTIKLKSETTSLKIRLADGTEIAGRIVLKDEDMDLAFIAPEKPLDDATKAKLAAISFAEPVGAQMQVLDRVFALGREGPLLNYAATVSMSRIGAVVPKPRLAYAVGGMPMGAPVFKDDGKLLGITVARHADKRSGGNRGPGIEASPVVIPATDVAKLIAQAKEEAAKAPEVAPKKEAPKTDAKPDAAPKADAPK